ncbi:zeta toxin family protein [Isoptericola rhizosphaerae]|uniref:zeta toxin family protein n=1 Tax=Isoptericola rhizosphaerae TaxID=3377837 RepID=UPI00383B0BD9
MSPEDQSDPIDAHRQAVRAFMRPDGPLGENSPHSSVRNPAWFKDGQVDQPRAARAMLHERLVAEYRADAPRARTERRAIVMAGPPGAGKGYTQRHVLGLEENAWLKIDPDEFKRELLFAALRDGSYETFLKPPEVAQREQAGEGFYPLELSSLVHEESSYLAARVRSEALEEGVNIVIDSVLSSPDKAEALGKQLAKAGYDVDVVDVEVPFEVSEAQIRQRWRQDYTAALTAGELAPDEHKLGGRWVPSQYARGVFDETTGRARSQESAERLSETCTHVMSYRRYWTPTAGGDRVLEVDKARIQRGGTLMPASIARATGAGPKNAIKPAPPNIDPPQPDPPTQQGPRL